MNPSYLISLALSALLLSLTGCGQANTKPQAEESETPATRVGVARVQQGDWTQTTRAVGTLLAWEETTLVNPLAGDVTTIHHLEGDRVATGTAIVQLDDTLLREERARAEASLREAEALFQRQSRLFDQAAISEAEFINAEAIRDRARAELNLVERRLQDTIIRAPFDGRLGRRMISEGAYLQPATPLFDLTQNERLRLEFSLPERFLPFVGEGLTVTFTTAGRPGQTFEGKVSFIDPRIDPRTRTLRLRATVENNDEALVANAFVQIEVTLAEIPDALTIPEESLITELGGFFVFVVNSDQTVSLKQVEPADRREGRIRISNGLAAGDLIVSDGHHRISEGSRVRWEPLNEG